MQLYQQQRTWQQLQNTMPKEFHIPNTHLPSEEWFAWQGHHIHLDCYRNPNAKAKVILFHGVGTNGRQMQMVLGYFLATQGFETIAIDMPTYGMTVVNPNKTVIYDDWIDFGNHYVQHEQQKDNRPIFLYGLSAGGMVAYDVASKNGCVHGIIGMTFLDQAIPLVRNETCRNVLISHIGTPLMPVAVKLGLGKFKMKMSWASKMWALCNDPKAQAIFMTDKTSAGNSASMAFLNSYMHAKRPVSPKDFAVCPILLTQPEQDLWTPLALSEPFLNQIQKVSVKTVMLPKGGHYPVEKEALSVLHQSALDFIQGILQGNH